MAQQITPPPRVLSVKENLLFVTLLAILAVVWWRLYEIKPPSIDEVRENRELRRQAAQTCLEGVPYSVAMARSCWDHARRKYPPLPREKE